MSEYILVGPTSSIYTYLPTTWSAGTTAAERAVSPATVEYLRKPSISLEMILIISSLFVWLEADAG